MQRRRTREQLCVDATLERPLRPRRISRTPRSSWRWEWRASRALVARRATTNGISLCPTCFAPRSTAVGEEETPGGEQKMSFRDVPRGGSRRRERERSLTRATRKGPRKKVMAFSVREGESALDISMASEAAHTHTHTQTLAHAKEVVSVAGKTSHLICPMCAAHKRKVVLAGLFSRPSFETRHIEKKGP